MSTVTDLVNAVKKRKIQHFSHMVRDENICSVTFIEGRATDKEATISPLLHRVPKKN